MNKDRVVNHLDEKKIDFSVPQSANDILRALPGKESKEAKLALRRACALNGNAKATQTTHDSVTFEFENGTTGTYTFSKSNGVNVSGDAFTFNGKPIQEITDKKDLKDMAEAIKDKNPNLDKQEVVDIIKGKDESGAGAAASSSDSGSGAGSKAGAASSSSGAGSKAGAADSSSGARSKAGAADSSSGDGSKSGAADSSSGDGSKSGAADSSSGDGSKSGAADSSSGDGSGDSSVGAGAADSSSGDGSGDGETPGNEENPETPGETPGEGETPTSDDNISPLISFFTDPKTVLISVASIAGIITLFSILSKTIKARFRKTAKSLYRLQKDFGGSPEGLNMDNAFKGQGSRITDLLVKVFGFGNKGKGAIGLVPFVKNYQDEIKRDYISATKAFNMVSQAGKDQPGAEIHSNESLNIPTYKSFREAYNARKLNESAYSGEEINESAVATISSALLLGRLAYSAGKFVWGKIGKDGKMENAQAVQVTKQSTREVCYSIMNCFFAKYFNMEGVSTKLGLDVNHLSDIDKSNVDKFKKLVISMKTEQKDNAKVSKMYSRVQKQYNEMLKRYFTIANKVVENFEKYSKLDKKTGKNKQLSEKESNMLTSGVEKLRMELSRQRDLYENNFFRVVNAIVASPEYIQYIDFIIDNVIPVFETGNAGDADYVLDTMPRKNEYFLVRQTRNSTEAPNPDKIDMRNGNVALVMVEDVTSGNGKNGGVPIIKFKRVGLFKSIKGDAEVKIQENGTVDYKTIKKREVKLDTTAYAKDVNGNEGGDSLSLEYTKWIAIDPIQVINYPPKEGNDTTSIDSSTTIGMSRRYNNTEELIFIVPVEDASTNNSSVEDASANNSEGRDAAEYKPDLAVNEGGEEGTEQVGAKKVAKIKFVTRDNENDQAVIITCDNVEGMTVDDVKTLLTGNDINGDSFADISPNDIQKIKNSVDKIEKSGNAKVQTINNSNKEDIINVINNKHYKTDVGNENNNSTKDEVAEALTEKLDIIVGNIIKVCDIKNFKLTRIDNNSYTYFYSLTYQYIPTGVTTTKNNEIAVRVYAYLKGDVPTTENRNKIINALNNNKVKLINEYKDTDISVDNNGNVFIYKNNLQIYFLLVKLVNGKANYDENAYDNQRLAKGTDNTSLSNNIKKGLEDLIKIYNSDKSDINENKKDVLESIKLEYTHSAVNESMTAVKLVRNAVFESNKNAYLVSMTCWGDGTRINPAKFLEESVKSVVYNATSYSDIANAAKKDKNLNILPLTESVTYQVPMPYNRYAILTNGNPLYEAVAVITIDATPDHNITSSKFIGVTRIVK